MIALSLALSISAQSDFSASMNRYLACVSPAIPRDLSSRDLATRSRVYREATAQCQSERQAAIEAAIRGREDGVSEAEARAQAIDIIDTLDPMSNVPKR